jgi:hypothetical protein
MTDLRTPNAFLHPRKIVPGCDHNRLYCKCDTPYWLRSSTLDETLLENKFYPPRKLLTSESPA